MSNAFKTPLVKTNYTAPMTDYISPEEFTRHVHAYMRSHRIVELVSIAINEKHDIGFRNRANAKLQSLIQNKRELKLRQLAKKDAWPQN